MGVGVDDKSTTVTPRDTTASVADSPAELTDGCHSVVDALRVNGYGPSTVWSAFRSPMWLAPHSRRDALYRLSARK